MYKHKNYQDVKHSNLSFETFKEPMVKQKHYGTYTIRHDGNEMMLLKILSKYTFYRNIQLDISLKRMKVDKSWNKDGFKDKEQDNIPFMKFHWVR